MCSDIPATPIECKPLRTTIIQVKPYIYEIVNGKRKRISPFVIENGVVVKIHERGIVRAFR